MPTPTADYQASMGSGLLMGTGTVYVFGAQGISGLGNPPTKTADVQLDGRDGVFASPDYAEARTLLLHLEIVEDEAADAFDALAILADAWLPTVANVNLHIQLPGWGHVYYTGRPRDLEADCTEGPLGHISCIAEFLATDPFAHDF